MTSARSATEAATTTPATSAVSGPVAAGGVLGHAVAEHHEDARRVAGRVEGHLRAAPVAARERERRRRDVLGADRERRREGDEEALVRVEVDRGFRGRAFLAVPV